MNYDNWKLMTPPEDNEVCILCYDRERAPGSELCPRCLDLEDFYSIDEQEHINQNRKL